MKAPRRRRRGDGTSDGVAVAVAFAEDCPLAIGSSYLVIGDALPAFDYVATTVVRPDAHPRAHDRGPIEGP